jgi:hypothetical protein
VLSRLHVSYRLLLITADFQIFKVSRVRIDKQKVREWAEANGIGLEPIIDVAGFPEGYGYKPMADAEEEGE